MARATLRVSAALKWFKRARGKRTVPAGMTVSRVPGVLSLRLVRDTETSTGKRERGSPVDVFTIDMDDSEGREPLAMLKALYSESQP